MYRTAIVRIASLLAITFSQSEAQNFSSGPIPMCDTSYFTAYVSGIGMLEPPGTGWGYSLDHIGIEITSNHPQTLVILLISPAGDTLLLSAHNGNGGPGYIGCMFGYSGFPSITTGNTPFTGWWTAQGGSFSIFDYTIGDGTWTIAVIDTACQGGGGGGGWTQGYFDGSGATAGIGFGANSPPCNLWIPGGVGYLCPGGSVNLNLTYPPFGMLSYTFYDPSWNIVSNPTSVSIPGVYYVEAFEWSTGCIYSAYFTIVAVPKPDLGPDQFISQCGNNPIDLNSLFAITGLYTQWYFNGSPITSAAASAAVAAGAYMLIVQDPNTCSDTAVIFLNPLPAPALGPDQSFSLCTYDTLDLSSLYNTNGFIATWSSSLGFPFDSTAVTTPGTYTLTVTSVGGCSDTADVFVDTISTPVLGSDQSYSLCSYDTLDLTLLYPAPGTLSSWLYNGNQVLNPNSIHAGGNYTLVATAPNGCSDTAAVTISNLPTPALGPDQTANGCSGNTIDLTNFFNTAGWNASWTIAGTAVANPAAVFNSGTYTLTAISPAGCSDTANLVLNITPTPDMGVDLSYDLCAYQSLDITSLFNTTGLITTWSCNGVPVTNPGSIQAAGTYTLIAATPDGCADTADVIINSLPTPALGPDMQISICNGHTTDLTSLYNTTGFTTSWTLSGLPVSNPSSAGVTGAYTLIATANGGCSDTATVNILVNPLPTPGPDQQVAVCDGFSIDLNSYFNTAGYAMSWSTGGMPVINPASVNQPGTYQVVATSAAGCTATAALLLAVNPVPALGADVPVTICSGTTTNLTGIFNTAGLTSSWTENGIAFPNPAAISTTGNFQLIVTNPFGCEDTAYVNHTVFTSPDLGPDQSYALCEWMTVDLGVLYNTAGLTSTWSFNGTQLTIISAIHDSGTYTINVTDSNGCTDEAQVFITNIACQCRADFTYQGNCRQDPFTFQINSDSAVMEATWRFSSSAMPELHEMAPEIKLLAEDHILITLEVIMGCGTVLVEKDVQVKDCSDSCHFYFPDAFTPNSDGMNDRFNWYGDCSPQDYLLEIHDRFGQLVFRTNNPTDSWDGRFKSTMAPVDIYVYHVEYRLPYQDKKAMMNKLTLLR